MVAAARTWQPDAPLNPVVPNDHCGRCGRFVGRDGDSGAPWGTSADQEPPDEEFRCGGCADRYYRLALRQFLKHGIPFYKHRSMWVPYDAWRRARGVARAMFNHGHPRPTRHEEVRREYRGGERVRYCRSCSRPEGHPCHEGIHRAHRAGVRPCHNTAGPDFAWSMSKPLRRSFVRVWCACGFSTEWAPGPEVPLLGALCDHFADMDEEGAS